MVVFLMVLHSTVLVVMVFIVVFHSTVVVWWFL